MSPWLDGDANAGILRVSDIVAALSYFVIAGYLLYFCRTKREHLPYPLTVAALVMTLIFRGIVVGGRALEFWNTKTLSMIVAPVAAFFAMYSAATISHLVLYFVKFKLPGEYKKLVTELQKELAVERLLSEDIEHLLDVLDARIERLESHLKHKGWVDEKNLELDELKVQLETLRVKHDNAVVCRNRPS